MGDRRPGLRHVAGDPAGRRRARAERLLRPVPGRGDDDELFAFERGERRSVGVEQVHGLADHGLEHGRRVELGREQASRAGQLLGERTRTALGLEEAAPVECAGGRGRHLVGELEVVAGEVAFFDEEHEHEPRRLAAYRNRQQRRKRSVAPSFVEPIVIRDPARRKQMPLERRSIERARQVERSDGLGQRMAADEAEPGRAADERG